MRLHRREMAFLESSPRAVLLGAVAVSAWVLAAYGGLYSSLREAAYWAMVAPSLAGFALACGVTTRDRESGLWKLLSASPTPTVRFLLIRWTSAAALGTLAGSAGLAILIGFSLIGVSIGAYELRLAAAVPLVAAAAAALGLLVGLMLGARSGQAGSATAVGGLVVLTLGARAALEAAGRLPVGSFGRLAFEALGVLSPASWGTRFAAAADPWILLALVMMAGGYFIAAVRVERWQLPSGEIHANAAVAAFLVGSAILLPAALHAMGDGAAPAAAPEDITPAEPLVVLLSDPPMDGEGHVQGPPMEVRRGDEIQASLGLFLPPGSRLTQIQVHLREADGDRNPRVVFEPSTFTIEAAEGREGAPAATWPVVLRVEGVSTLDMARVVAVAEVESLEARGDNVLMGPFVRKDTTVGADFALLAAIGGLLVLLVSLPYVSRARRIRGMRGVR